MDGEALPKDCAPGARAGGTPALPAGSSFHLSLFYSNLLAAWTSFALPAAGRLVAVFR